MQEVCQTIAPSDWDEYEAFQVLRAASVQRIDTNLVHLAKCLSQAAIDFAQAVAPAISCNGLCALHMNPAAANRMFLPLQNIVDSLHDRTGIPFAIGLPDGSRRRPTQWSCSARKAKYDPDAHMLGLYEKCVLHA